MGERSYSNAARKFLDEKAVTHKELEKKSFYVAAAASPPDVRQGYALPSRALLDLGLSPNCGHSPRLKRSLPGKA